MSVLRESGMFLEKKKDPLFRLKDSERLILKVRDPDSTKLMVSKLREKSAQGELNSHKFRGLTKGTTGLRLGGGMSGKSSQLVTLDGTENHRTSRELGTSRRGEFAIKNHGQSFRFKTQE